MKIKATIFGFLVLISAVFIFIYSNQESKEEKVKPKRKTYLGKFINFKKGEHLTIQHSEDLNPVPEKNFYLLAWINPKDYPQEKERVIFLEKFDHQNNQSGYAVAISQYKDDFYPQVYWQSAELEGRWYSFDRITPKKNKWYGILLSYTDNKYLGLHLFYIQDDEVVIQLLGGYELDSIFPNVSTALKVGSIKNGLFEGKIARLALWNSTPEDLALESLLIELQDLKELDFDQVKGTDPKLFVSSQVKDETEQHQVKFIKKGKKKAQS